MHIVHEYSELRTISIYSSPLQVYILCVVDTIETEEEVFTVEIM